MRLSKLLVVRARSIIALAWLVGLSACGGQPTTPDGTATAFLQAMQERRFAQAADLVDADSKPILLAVQSYSKNLDPDEQRIVAGIGGGSIALGKVNAQNDTATVQYTVGGGVAETLALTRENGAWKVHYQARSLFP